MRPPRSLPLSTNRYNSSGYNTITTEAQLETIRTAAAFAPISAAAYADHARAFLRITGTDATRWLNGMVTNNIKDLAPGQGNYNFLLNAQGRIQADCNLYREPGEGAPTFLLETDNSQLETVKQSLDRFIIMDDVELSPVFDFAAGLMLIGSDAPKILETLLAASLQPGTMLPTKANGADIVVLAPPAAAVPVYGLWFSTQQDADAVGEQLLAHGVQPVSPEALEAHRILSATPRYGQDIRNTETAKDLPQETAQTHALHFAKGCYLGQEIVERIHSRGQVHRTFSQFRLTGDLPTLPTTLEANGKQVGELTSAARIGDDILALGYIRREALSAPINYPGGTATPL